MKKKFDGSISFFLIVTAVLAFRSVFFEPYKIPTGSMIPTLLIGDFILVNKFSYGLKVPFSHFFNGKPTYITDPKQPERGDIIVFIYPGDNSTNYIKRVVGLPGDTIEVIDKKLFINNKPVKSEPMDGSKIMADMDDKYKYNSFEFFKSQTGEHEHVTQVDQDNFAQNDFPRLTVPEGKFFVMGDNRDHSADSRFWGFVPFENIKGEALIIWFSMTLPFEIPILDPPGLDHPLKWRPWRIGTVLK